ncbi:MAG: CocE/NonD family hydrolase, partial [Bacteroidota bacterium]
AGDLYLPNTTDAFPTILIMTPYGKVFYELNGLPLGIGDNISESDYAILIVDWRCRFASLSACAQGADNGEDGYDVVEWAAAQTWSNGKIGMWGPSALGNIQFQTASKKPPHLVCSVPEVAGPHFAYPKYFPGGALVTERLETLTLLFPGSFDLVIGNPHTNLLWTIAENSSMYPEDIEVPMLLIGGWYDINLDQTIYLSDTLAKNSPIASQHKTLIGPWVHGGTGQAVVGSTNQGELSYPEAKNWNTNFALQFFDYHLRGIDNGWSEKPSRASETRPTPFRTSTAICTR